MTAPIASPVPPDLRALLDSVKADWFSTFNCHQVGTIISFDAAKQTASVQIAQLAQVNGTPLTYPPLVDCPVLVLNGGGATLEFPIAAGDSCVVLFNDTDLDTWFNTSASQVPNTNRTHSLSDGLVLVGVRNSTNPLPGYDATKLRLQYAGAVIAIDAGGDVTITSAGGATAALTDKVAVANDATDLKAALDALCDTLTAWVNTGGSTPNAATLIAIAAVKTQLGTLLT